jgi:hypothetical protein
MHFRQNSRKTPKHPETYPYLVSVTPGQNRMTVIATVITSQFTAHASDSFITERLGGGRYKRQNDKDQTTKIVRAEAFKGAIVYWGLANHGDWNTLKWLQNLVKNNRLKSAQDFAAVIAGNLTMELRRLRFRRRLDSGIGMHFTAYENVEGYKIPELFVITNFEDTRYAAVIPEFRITRETHAWLIRKAGGGPLVEDGEPNRRLAVRDALQREACVFNNGNPGYFNIVQESVSKMLLALRTTGQLRDVNDWRVHAAFARLPVKIVSDLVQGFAHNEKRIIGGRPHDLVITPDGHMESTTGD